MKTGQMLKEHEKSDTKTGLYPCGCGPFEMCDVCYHEQVMMNNIVNELCDSGVTESRSEARRKIAEGAVKVNGRTITDFILQVQPGDELQVARRPAVIVGNNGSVAQG